MQSLAAACGDRGPLRIDLDNRLHREGHDYYGQDDGEVSWRIPLARMNWAFPESVPIHHWAWTALSGHPAGDAGPFLAAQSLALAAIRLLAEPSRVRDAQAELQRRTERGCDGHAVARRLGHDAALARAFLGCELERGNAPPMKVITSSQNETIKFVRSLQAKRDRLRTSQFAVEGDDLLRRAKACGWAPDILLMRDPMSPFRGWAREEILVKDAVMAAISRQANPPDHVAVFTRRLPNTMPQPAPDDIWIGLEDIRDPGNLGTIIRTADAAGAAGVVLIGECCDPYSPECVRATTGSIFAVPLVSAERAGISVTGLARRYRRHRHGCAR